MMIMNRGRGSCDMAKKQTVDPSPEQIAAECLLIQATWSPAERMKRLRADLRPQYQRCDGVMADIDVDDYETHIDQHEALVRQADE